jgi:FkbM family methyltransferase
MDNFEVFNTPRGIITLYKNEKFIINGFREGRYKDLDNMLELKKNIDPNRNILEIGGHCGTSSIVYASFLNDGKKLHVYEPQRNMYNLLVRNIKQNNLEDKIIPNNSGVFCYNGKGNMHNIDLDGGMGEVSKRYTTERHLECNFGGIGLGAEGEDINVVTIDSMDLDDIGFIHCDAQGSENFIFSQAKETIKKHRPVIFFEQKDHYGTYLYDNICKHYPQYKTESEFDLSEYCMKTLNYSQYIHKFANGIDSLLIP